MIRLPNMLILFALFSPVPATSSLFAQSNHPEFGVEDDFDASIAQPSDGIQLFDMPVLEYKLDLSEFKLLTLNRMTGNGKGMLAFLDYSDEQIVLFDPNTSESLIPFKKFGGGLGQNPEDIGNSFDIKFLADDELIITDIANNRLSKWNTDGSFSGIMKLESIVPSRIAMCDDGTLYLLMQNYSKAGTITRIDVHSGKPLSTFQKVKRFDMQSVFHRDGSLVCHNGELIYGAYYLDFLKRYDPEGKIHYSQKVMGFKANEELVITGDNEMGSFIRRSPEARRSIGELRIFKNYLFVGFSGDSDSLLRRIDVYDPMSGFYLGTIPMQEPFEEFEIDETGLYVLTSPLPHTPPYLIRYEWEMGKVYPKLRSVDPEVIQK